MNSLIILVFSLALSLIASIANIFLKIGSNSFFSLPIFIGFSLYGVAAIFFLILLKKAEVSFIWPIFSTTYVWVALLAFIFLNENFGLFKIIGTLLIVFGVALVALKK